MALFSNQIRHYHNLILMRQNGTIIISIVIHWTVMSVVSPRHWITDRQVEMHQALSNNSLFSALHWKQNWRDLWRELIKLVATLVDIHKNILVKFNWSTRFPVCFSRDCTYHFKWLSDIFYPYESFFSQDTCGCMRWGCSRTGIILR